MGDIEEVGGKEEMEEGARGEVALVLQRAPVAGLFARALARGGARLRGPLVRRGAGSAASSCFDPDRIKRCGHCEGWTHPVGGWLAKHGN